MTAMNSLSSSHAAQGIRVAAIRAIHSYLPPDRLTNEDLAAELGDWAPSKIFDKTGIRARHIAGAGECASDLGVAAAVGLFERGVCSPEDVDFLLFCTQSPDHPLPATACTLQQRLGLRTDCGALDFNQGCSGFVYGLALAKGLIETAGAANVLLITAETYSKFLNRKDRGVRTIFGDGAAATLVSAVESDNDEPAIGPFVFGTDGRGAANLIVARGGARQPVSASTTKEGVDPSCARAELFMNGPEVFNFTLAAVPAAVNALIEKWRQPIERVHHFVFHQANKFMLDRLRDKLRIPPEKFWIDMEETGNTVSSTIPIALEQAAARDWLRPNSDVMLVGFGVGYSWAASMVKTSWI
jgi:3-oxoacyl-[acyl-carrier-protein] synthase III